MNTLTKEALAGYFRRGFKPRAQFKVGVEWEKIGVYRDSGKAIAYSGPNGVEAILRALVRQFSWQPVSSGGHLIALRKGAGSITLEPGGQIELSGRTSAALDENAAELYAHLSQIKQVSDPMNIAWLGIGMQPISRIPQIQWVPKERYKIMRASLRNKGTLTHAMMKQTASIQVSLDYEDEPDAINKLRLAMGLAPILSAMFANSPISEGRLNGFYSKRSQIWAHTAPERTGIIEEVFRPDFGFEDYVDYALSVPLLFIVRGGRWISGENRTFAQFLKNGLKGHVPDPEDWELHLSTIFTEARLKTYLEIRSVDCQKEEFGLSVPALLKGLFYDTQSQRKAWGLVAGFSSAQRRVLRKKASVDGLKASIGKTGLLEISLQLVKWAEEGLGRLEGSGLARKNEMRYLQPLKAMLLRGEVPAQCLISCFSGKLNKKEKISRLIHCAAI